MPDAPKTVNRAYVGLRHDIVELIPRGVSQVLDVGCASGAMGEFLQAERDAAVSGIEYNETLAARARERLTRVWVGDLNTDRLDSFSHETKYDLIIFGDILEHLIDPWEVLSQARAQLRTGGHIITSLPNVCHYSTLWSLAFAQHWPYRERGIHDRTHLRFFSRRNMTELFSHAGLRPVEERRNLRLWESQSFVDPCARLLDFFPFRAYVTFQYLHLLRAD